MGATYRIGPSDFFTPGDLSSDADTVQAQVVQLDAQIEGNILAPTDVVDQWTAFHQAWTSFYGDHFGGFFSSLLTSANDANRDDLIRYENQLADFQARAKTFGADIIAPVGPSSGSKDTLGAQLAAQGLPGTGTLVLLAAAAVAVIIAWKK